MRGGSILDTIVHNKYDYNIARERFNNELKLSINKTLYEKNLISEAQFLKAKEFLTQRAG